MKLLEKLNEMMAKNIEVRFQPEQNCEVVRITSLFDGKFVDSTITTLSIKELRYPEEEVVGILDSHQDLLTNTPEENPLFDKVLNIRKDMSADDFRREFCNEPQLCIECKEKQATHGIGDKKRLCRECWNKFVGYQSMMDIKAIKNIFAETDKEREKLNSNLKQNFINFFRQFRNGGYEMANKIEEYGLPVYLYCGVFIYDSFLSIKDICDAAGVMIRNNDWIEPNQLILVWDPSKGVKDSILSKTFVTRLE